jgi:microcystin-dependent protein
VELPHRIVADPAATLNFERLQQIISALQPPGAILPYAGATAPSGFLLCDGSAVSRTEYAALFAVCGTTFGAGDGSTTFNVPDLRGRVPVGVDGSAGRLSANDALGNTAGAETHALSSAELAAHTHAVGTFAVGNEAAHTHGTGTYAVGNEAAHTHGATGLTISGGAHTHSASGDRATNNTATGAGGVITTLSANNAGNQDALTTTEYVGGSPATHTHTVGGNTAAGSSHTHSLSGSSAAGSSHTHALTGSSASTGSGTAHNNLQPYQITQYLIKT